MTHAHPRQVMVSDDPMDYYFGEHVALETIHDSAGAFATKQNLASLGIFAQNRQTDTDSPAPPESLASRCPSTTV